MSKGFSGPIRKASIVIEAVRRCLLAGQRQAPARILMAAVLCATIPVAADAQTAEIAKEPVAAKASTQDAATKAPGAASMTMDQFLDRLMIAESGGRLEARNPRSTAVGPFQFIERTFLDVARRHFASETTGKSPQEILALRTDLAFSRRAAEVFTRDNAAILQSLDVAPTYPNLRLAFLLGPAGAARVLKAPPEAPLAGLLGPAVLVANPFMASLTAQGLIARSAREVAQPVTTSQGVEVPAGSILPRRALPPAVAVRCNLRLPSCKRWLALHTAKARSAKMPSTAIKVASLKNPSAGPLAKATRGKAGGRQRLVRVSPTMEAAARGIPFSVSPIPTKSRTRSTGRDAVARR